MFCKKNLGSNSEADRIFLKSNCARLHPNSGHIRMGVDLRNIRFASYLSPGWRPSRSSGMQLGNHFTENQGRYATKAIVRKTPNHNWNCFEDLFSLVHTLSRSYPARGYDSVQKRPLPIEETTTRNVVRAFT